MIKRFESEHLYVIETEWRPAFTTAARAVKVKPLVVGEVLCFRGTNSDDDFEFARVARPQQLIGIPRQAASYTLGECSPALAILNQDTRNAVVRHLPLELTCDWHEVAALAVTALNENSTRRTRLLCRDNLPKVLAFCRDIFVAGGAINVDDLPWLDIFVGHYGWTLELVPQREELRALWRDCDRTPHQPQW